MIWKAELIYYVMNNGVRNAAKGVSQIEEGYVILTPLAASLLLMGAEAKGVLRETLAIWYEAFLARR